MPLPLSLALGSNVNPFLARPVIHSLIQRIFFDATHLSGLLSGAADTELTLLCSRNYTPSSLRLALQFEAILSSSLDATSSFFYPINSYTEMTVPQNQFLAPFPCQAGPFRPSPTYLAGSWGQGNKSLLYRDLALSPQTRLLPAPNLAPPGAGRKRRVCGLSILPPPSPPSARRFHFLPAFPPVVASQRRGPGPSPWLTYTQWCRSAGPRRAPGRGPGRKAPR